MSEQVSARVVSGSHLRIKIPNVEIEASAVNNTFLQEILENLLKPTLAELSKKE
jgi:hypothetical protein